MAITATARKVRLDLDQSLEHAFHRQGISEASSVKASELLQENLERYHIFFNSAGFHNHIVHHLLTIWALKASPKELQRGYDTNKSYQRPAQKPDEKIVDELYDPTNFIRHCGGSNYNDFLEFFQREIEKKGWQAVLNEHVFAGDKRADHMLALLFSGILHPLIHLGFGVEFSQPAIIAEALAQTACHSINLHRLLLSAEKAAKYKEDKPIVELLEQIRTGSRQSREEVLSHVRVTPDKLEEKTAEMINAITYFTGGITRRSNDIYKFDFYLIHSVNASVFFTSFLRQDWLSTANKVRLLEWKIRMDLDSCASKGSTVNLDFIEEYKPKKPSGWDGIEDRTCALDEDGHASKLIRALAHGERSSQPYEDNPNFRLKQKHWLQLAHMTLDSVEKVGDSWARL